MKITKDDIKKSMVDTVPVLSGYIVLGFGFGIIMKSKGYGFLWPVLMSVVIYAGSMQYVAVDLICSGANFLTFALTTLLVNARHLFYGISMLDKYRCLGKTKAYAIFTLTDETYSLVCNAGQIENPSNYYFLVSLFDHIYWILGTALGSAVGSLIEINPNGLDFALTALFFTVFIDQWKETTNHLFALIGVFSTVVCLILFGKNNFLIPSMGVILLFVAVSRKLKFCEVNDGQ